MRFSAQNLILFMQIGDGIDDETWLYHLRRGDYSNWFANIIKDNTLARETQMVEKQNNISAGDAIKAVLNIYDYLSKNK